MNDMSIEANLTEEDIKYLKKHKIKQFTMKYDHMEISLTFADLK